MIPYGGIEGTFAEQLSKLVGIAHLVLPLARSNTRSLPQIATSVTRWSSGNIMFSKIADSDACRRLVKGEDDNIHVEFIQKDSKSRLLVIKLQSVWSISCGEIVFRLQSKINVVDKISVLVS